MSGGYIYIDNRTDLDVVTIVPTLIVCMNESTPTRWQRHTNFYGERTSQGLHIPKFIFPPFKKLLTFFFPGRMCVKFSSLF